MTAEAYPVPVIVGSVRSGTTMFCLMLHAHPQLAMGFEPYFVPAMWPMRDRWERPDEFDLDRYVDDLIEHPEGKRFRDRMGIPPDVPRDRLHGVADIDYADAVRRVYHLYTERQGRRATAKRPRGFWSPAPDP